VSDSGPPSQAVNPITFGRLYVASDLPDPPQNRNEQGGLQPRESSQWSVCADVDSKPSGLLNEPSLQGLKPKDDRAEAPAYSPLAILRAQLKRDLARVAVEVLDGLSGKSSVLRIFQTRIRLMCLCKGFGEFE
jgi:hypothetical protein